MGSISVFIISAFLFAVAIFYKKCYSRYMGQEGKNLLEANQIRSDSPIDIETEQIDYDSLKQEYIMRKKLKAFHNKYQAAESEMATAVPSSPSGPTPTMLTTCEDDIVNSRAEDFVFPARNFVTQNDVKII